MLPDLNKFRDFDFLILEGLRRNNVHPVIIYVFKKTGILLTNYTLESLTQEQMQAVRKVSKEYLLLEVEMSRKVQ